MFGRRRSHEWTDTHPTNRNRIYLLARRVRTRGIRQAVQHYLHRRPPSDADRIAQSSLPADLRINSVNARWGLYYAPSRSDIVSKAIWTLPIRFEDYTFIDLGAGKGDSLLLAAECKFGSVVGVEYSEVLTAIASANVRAATVQMSMRVECICADATEFDLPHDPLVLYMYNPFQGRVMDRVVKKIEHAIRDVPRDLWIVYVNPWEHRKFVRSRYLKTVVENWEMPDWEFCIYRSTTPDGSIPG